MRKHWAGRLALAAVMAASSASVLLTTATAAHAAAPCDMTAWSGFAAAANNTYVSAEVTYAGSSNGMLRARANTQGAFERFQFVRTSDGHMAIKSLANGKYVSAELGATGSNYGMLRARATTIGLWEKFDSVPTMGCAIRSVANGRYVSAEIGNNGATYGELRARSTTIGAWEVFGPKTSPPPPGLHCPQWGVALVQYFGYVETPKADAIMWRESRCIPTVTNSRGCDSSGRTNSHAKGLMQMCVPLLDAQFDAVGCHANYLDGICNIRAAKHLRDQVGWGPWGG